MMALYLTMGLFYAAFLFYIGEEEDTKIGNLRDLVRLVVMGVGTALLWPLVGYINHMWKPSGDINGKN